MGTRFTCELMCTKLINIWATKQVSRGAVGAEVHEQERGEVLTLNKILKRLVIKP